MPLMTETYFMYSIQFPADLLIEISSVEYTTGIEWVTIFYRSVFMNIYVDQPMDDTWHFYFESQIIVVGLEGRRNL